MPEKEEYCGNVNMEDITDANYLHVKKACKDFEMKNLGKYHDLYLKSDTLLFVNVSENFRKMCLKICQIWKQTIRQNIRFKEK